MKKNIIIYLSILFSFSINAQEIPVPLLDRANNSEYIFEGVVIETNSYFTNNERNIYTSNTIQITKILKGDIECGLIEIITNGGVKDSRSISLSHSLELKKGDMGIFLCKDTDRPVSIVDFNLENNSEILEGHFENQSFIRYWWSGSGLSAADLGYNYENLIDIYNLAELITGFSFTNCSLDNPIVNYENTNQSYAKINSAVTPNISGFTPSTVAGGIKDIVTITGSGFLSSPGTNGKILLPNVDNGGASFIAVNKEDIYSWSDSEIKFYVPAKIQTDLSIVHDTPVGSGKFIVVDSNNQSTISSNILTINYSIKNMKYQNTITDSIYPITRTILAPPIESERKFIFHCDNAVAEYEDGKMKEVIAKALNYWTCATGIHWELGADINAGTNYVDSLYDGKNVIHFGNLSYPKILVTTSHLNYFGVILGSNDTTEYFIQRENDITINNLIQNWNFDTTGVDIGTDRDFYEVILHELGHAHGIEHVMDSTQIMYFNATSERLINLGQDNSCILAGTDIINYSTNPINYIDTTNAFPVSYFNIDANSDTPCNSLSIDDISVTSNIEIYPNPCDNFITLSIDDNFSSGILSLTNVQGKQVFNKEIVSGELEIDLSYLSSGLYFGTIKSENLIYGAFKVVKK
jgi:hypothetical protein